MYKLLGLTAISLVGAAAALEITFPSSDANSYWRACNNNTLRWTSNSSDPTIFSVALLNGNQSDLNGNFQVANSLETSAGQATIFIDCIATGSYSALLVNASKYELNNPQVFAQSAAFSVMPNGTAAPSGGNSSGANSASNSNGGGAGTTSSTSSGAASAPTDIKPNSAVASGVVGFAAIPSLVAVGLALLFG